MRRIPLRNAGCAAGLLLASTGWSLGQTLKLRPPAEQNAQQEESQKHVAPQIIEAPLVTVPMSVPSGTPIKVALDSEVRIREVGQSIHGKTTEPVYAFDKLLIPVGTPVNGRVSAIDGVPKRVRTMQAMDGNLSPIRAVPRVISVCSRAGARPSGRMPTRLRPGPSAS